MAELIPISFPRLLQRIYHEHERSNSIFDLPARKFYRPSHQVDMSVSFCGNAAANPVGPAAGPQTQLAQNIVLSWLAGSRILELKTVQINDHLQLTRPCIDMASVGYNTEWSQELRLDESLREYVKASMIIEILKPWLFYDSVKSRASNPNAESQESKLNSEQLDLATIFDVSVGYDLAGIRSPQICQWLHTMRDASAMVEEYRRQIPSEFKAYRDLPFTTEIANSITLSTFHGTPANEIERICEFLLTEMDYHVIIKMNPPMLGKERIESLLYDKLGYTDIGVHQKIYDVNITFTQAVEVVTRLQRTALARGKTIGVKFGNTLEVINKKKFLKDNIQYLSGQPLHVLHLALVQEWRKVFGAEFPISFSAGVDANNFADCVGIGLVPVTTCTDLLRPGGYGRLPQYLLNLEQKMTSVGARTIREFILKSHKEAPGFELLEPAGGSSTLLQNAIHSNTVELFKRSIENPRYHHSNNQKLPRKIGSDLHLWDCINCDKCIPVCPNDANFYFEVEPVVIQYRNIELTGRNWREIDGGTFKIEETHQIANFADACNDCGNCDVFCPEDGGPYIEKPRFFGSLEAYHRWKSLSGFVLAAEGGKKVLYGRFRDDEFSLTLDDEKNAFMFTYGEVVTVVATQSNEVQSVTGSKNPGLRVIDMRYYLVMKTLLQGMLNKDRIHFVNVGIV